MPRSITILTSFYTFLLIMSVTCVYAQFKFIDVIRDGDDGMVDGLHTPSHVVVSPDNEYVYVAGAGDNAIAMFKRDTRSGALTFVEAVKDGENGVDGLAGVREIAISSEGKYLYAVADVDNAISTFSINENGKLQFLQTLKDGVDGVDGLAGARALAVSPDGENIYVAASADDAVAVFSINNENGLLTYVHAIIDNATLKLNNANGVVVSPDNKHVYVIGLLDDGISVFERNTEDQGRLSNNVQNIDNWAVFLGAGNARPTDIIISNNGNNVFVSGYGGESAGNLTSFARNKENGLLSKVQGFADNASIDTDNFQILPRLGRLTSLVFTSNQAFIYTVSHESPTGFFGNDVEVDFRINWFSHNLETGVLTPKPEQGIFNGHSGVVEGIEKPSSITFSDDGNFFYVVSEENALTIFSVFFPSITSFSPKEGMNGTVVTIRGEDFGHIQGNSMVKFAVDTAEIVSWSDTAIVAKVPSIGAGDVNISITVNNFTDTSTDKFKFIESSIVINDFAPDKGKTGTTIGIRGTNFGTDGDERKVFLGDTEITDAVWVSADSISAVVPAMEDGPVKIRVVVNGETGISNNDFVIDNQPPTITFTPSKNASGVGADQEIKIKFSEAVTTLDGQPVDSENVGGLFKVLDEQSGSISFSAEITSNEVTITPTVPWSISTTYQVLLLDTLQDVVGNQVFPDTLTFTTLADTDGPVATVSFSDSDGKVQTGQLLTITATFNEPIADKPAMKIALIQNGQEEAFPMKKISDTEYTYEYKAGANGGEVGIRLQDGTDVQGQEVEEIVGSNSFFIDNTPPVPMFDPAHKASEVATETTITVSINEAVRNIDNSAISNEDIQQIFDFQKILFDDAEPISFTGNYNPSTFSFSLQPSSLDDNAFYQVILNELALEDEADNSVGGQQTVFKTGKYEPDDIIPHTHLITRVDEGEILIDIDDANSVFSAKLRASGIQNCNQWNEPTNLFLNTETNAFHLSFDTIPDAIGIAYQYTVTDKFGYTYDSILYYYNVLDKGMNANVRSGKTKSAYQIISFPLDIENNKVFQVFDELGDYNKANWRLFTLDNMGEFIEYSDFPTIEAGKGYLLIFRDSTITSINSGKGKTVEANKDAPFGISVRPGWNLIGNPYNFDVLWSSIIDFQGEDGSMVPNDIREYSENWEAIADTLHRGGGNLVFVHGDASLIKVPVICKKAPDGSGGRIDNQKISKNQWEIPLSLEQGNGNIKRTVAGFGMHPAALISRDKYDVMSPPHFGNYLNLSFQHPEYFYPRFAKDIVPIQDAYIWDFQVETNIADDILIISWDKQDTPADGKQIFLMDVQENKIVNMRKEPSYSFVNNGPRTFKVFYGNQAFIDEHLLPQEVSLHANYPNPFSEQTTISFTIPNSDNAYRVQMCIYDISGRHVATLKDELVPTGFHKVLWDGKGATGNKLKSGMYFLELVADDGVNRVKKGSRLLLVND